MMRTLSCALIFILLTGCGKHKTPEEKLGDVIAEFTNRVVLGDLAPGARIRHLTNLPGDLVKRLNEMRASLTFSHAYQIAPGDYFGADETIDYTLLFSSPPHWIGIRMKYDKSTGMFTVIDFRDVHMNAANKESKATR